jgi:monofunctional biosynthetic peptidoglycan transglycosylase
MRIYLPMWRYVLLFLISAGFLALLFVGFRSITDVGILRTRYPRVTYDPKTEKATITIVKQRPLGWVDLGQVSKVAWSAIVMSEDDAFWTHGGFDWNQMREAFETNLQKHKFARGGSTITQQVAKNVFLSNEKTVVRKLKEAFLTTRLERHVGKKRILEIYLNIAELGPGVYGIGHASQYYFHKPASQLTAKEGAFLAILLPSPKRYSVSFRKHALTPFANETVANLLGKLLAVHKISEAEYEHALTTPLSFEADQSPRAVSKAEGPDDEDQAPEEVETVTVPETGSESDSGQEPAQ